MRFVVYATFLVVPLMLPIPGEAAAQNLPACNKQAITRNGNQITIGFEQLASIFNKNLKAAHSSFSNLRLSAEGSDKLKVSGMNNGKPVAIGDPLEVVSGNALKLHAQEILQNGTPEKGLMNLTGKTLADYAHFKDTQSLSTRDDDIYIHPDPLLNLSGRVIGVSLNHSSVILKFASQPCR